MSIETNKTFGFSKALKLIKKGEAVARADWWGGKYIAIVTEDEWDIYSKAGPQRSFNAVPFILIANVDEDTIGPWIPTYEELFATDWEKIKKDYE